ncbi:MAG: Ig-like domain-containing protein, partial [Paracoccaceae bacterium]
WAALLDLTSLSDGPVQITASVSNRGDDAQALATMALIKDTSAPAGHSVAFGPDRVNAGSAQGLGFALSGAEVGASFAWSITSTGGGAPITGTGTVSNATDQITGIDASGLGDGTLTLSVVLTDAAGNPSAPVGDSIVKDAAAPQVVVAGPIGPLSEAFTVTVTFSEPVTGFGTDDLQLTNGTASDMTGRGPVYSLTVTPAHDGRVEVRIGAGAAVDTAGNASTISNLFTVEAALTGTPDPAPDPDADGDGLADGYESPVEDRDGDGIPDAQDYDPQGYFYCEDDGRILPGGGITVTGPDGSNASLGTRNSIRIDQDGSTGSYQWFALRPGHFSVTYHYPPGVGVPSTTRLSSGVLDVTTLLPNNPAILGSFEFGSSGFLADPGLGANPVFYSSFDIEAGDPHVLGNNIPMTQCAENAVRIAVRANGVEANGAVPTDAGFVVTQGRVALVDTVVAYTVGGTATPGADFAALSGTVTIPAGQTSAPIDVTVLEDSAIEGQETLVITLTGITAGDPVTRLDADPATLTVQASIADDDFANVIVVNLDLATTEGRAGDTARMSFALAGAPNAEVTIDFAGDSQCTVSPASLRFDSGNHNVAQILTITAIDDAVDEGAHTCQPTVAIRSADARFDGLAVALAPVMIADDLVDIVRTPLTDILQSDFERTIGMQTLRFSGIARQALRRLQAGQDDTRCGVVEAFDVDGGLRFGVDGGQSTGTFREDVISCQTGVRRILDGGFTVSMTPGLGWQWALGFSVQHERQRQGTDLFGRFWGGYVSRNDAGAQADGRIDGMGLNGGVYGARAFSNGLFLDYYAAAAVGYHRYGLTFADPAGPILAQGSYRYAGLFGGVALSGQTRVGRALVAPRIGLDFAHARAMGGSVTASQMGFSDTGTIDLRPVNGLRAFVETRVTLNAAEVQDTPRPRGAAIEITPRLFCERGLGNAGAACGFGGSLRLSNADPDSDLSYQFVIDAERAGDVGRATLEFSRTRRLMGGAGSFVTGLNLDHTGRAQARMQMDLRF